MTPLWVPLVVALIAICGVLITQARADKREVVARKHEQERERDRWSREDAARTFEHRRTVYADFYNANGELGLWVHDYYDTLYVEPPDPDYDPELPLDWAAAEYKMLELLELYATPRVARLAHEAHLACMAWGLQAEREPNKDKFRERQEQWELARRNLLAAIRQDLGVPEH
jgi:hypothetical protein